MVVQVHGSQVADVNEFQGTWMNWGQLLAARGYAVLLPNYRGSLTDGASFARANQGDLGGKDFEDIMDGVDAMVQQGIADPERLGIGGVSYGGFLTAWAVTQTSRFKAAVMGLGISNWISMAGQTPGPEGMVRFYWLSSPYERSDLFWRRSPLAQVSKVKTPVLIYAGERDPLVPVSQSREFFRGLQHFAVPSQFILYPREGHSIQEPNHLRDNLNRLLDWYDRYLKSSS
jgi:dipeptidyl aminopeptidase/acylaminoacyl peptidase